MTKTTTRADYFHSLLRRGGALNAVGGVAVATAYVLHPHTVPPEIVASGFWILVHAIFLVSLLAGTFGLFALFAACVARGGRGLALAGTTMAVLSLVLIAGLDYSEVFIFPTLAVEFPEVIVKYGAGDKMPSVAFAFPASGLLFVAGYLSLTRALRVTGTIGRTSAVAMTVGVVVFTVGLSGFVPMLFTQVGAVLFGLGLVLFGRELWSEPEVLGHGL